MKLENAVFEYTYMVRAFTGHIILTRKWRKEGKGGHGRNVLIFLPRGALMGYEPFQSHRAERKMVALATRQASQLHILPRASNLFSEWRLEQVANLDDAKIL